MKNYYDYLSDDIKEGKYRGWTEDSKQKVKYYLFVLFLGLIMLGTASLIVIYYFFGRGYDERFEKNIDMSYDFVTSSSESPASEIK